MPEQAKRQTIEHYGLGQSGYTAGRVEGDPSLQFDARNVCYPRSIDEREVDDPDERFTGRGGLPWG